MEEEKEYYGEATLGYGSPKERKVKIEEYMAMNFIDNRRCSIMKLVDEEGYILSVENYKSSGRGVQETMFLSEESLYGIFSSMAIYFNQKKIDPKDAFTKIIEKDKDSITYDCSPNLEIEKE